MSTDRTKNMFLFHIGHAITLLFIFCNLNNIGYIKTNVLKEKYCFL